MSQGGHGMQQDGDATCVACLCDCDVEKVDGADLQIIKLVDNPTPNLNGEVVWTIVVTNNGPEDAENVVVNDNLPAGVEYVSDSATMGEFDEAAGVWEILLCKPTSLWLAVILKTPILKITSLWRVLTP